MRLLSLFLLPILLFSEEMQTRTQVLMGTFAHITLPEQNNKQISDSFSLIHTLETVLSSYGPHLVYKLNQTHTVPYNATLSDALQLSQQYYKDTHGYFDITIGSISKKLYHFGEEKTYSPSEEALKSATRNINGIHISKDNIRSDGNIVIDLGGMGKGYAVDKVVAYLKEQNISKGIVALSGDIQCLHKCDLFLQSPFHEGTFAKINAKIAHLSISTSGTYRRYASKKSEHHLINPKTATQGKDFVSVSLFTQGNNSKIDAYATAVSVMPKEKALSFLIKQKDIGYVLVEPDGNIVFGNLEIFLDISW